jgi:phage shock protein PspC (stress-responsive transcriptional regulator)
MLKILLAPAVILAVLFAPAVVIVVNIVAFISIVVYTLYSFIVPKRSLGMQAQ